MRIVVLSTRELGEKIVEAILASGDEVVGVYGSPTPAGVRDRMEEVAKRHGLPFQTVKKSIAGTEEFLENYKKLEPELNVMGGLRAFLPQSVLDYPRLGTVGWHPSLLPKYAGANSLCWPIINGETETANTVFWADHGIDSGPILLQKKVAIDPDETFLSLYRNKIVPGAIEMILEAIARIKDGTAQRVPQDLSQYTYYSFITEKDAEIRWKQPGQVIYNLIRGTNPNPGASAVIGEKKLRIYDVELQRGFSEKMVQQVVVGQMKAGTIAEISEAGILVAVPDGAILIKTTALDGQKMTAAQAAAALELKVGDCFNAN